MIDSNIKNIKIRTIIPFYNKMDANKVYDLRVLNPNNFSNYLDKKIDELNNSVEKNIFIKNKNDSYVKETTDSPTLSIKKNFDNKHMFNFALNVDVKNEMFLLAEQIQLSFYVDSVKKESMGAFSFNTGKLNEKLYGDRTKKIYLQFFINNFIKKNFFPLDINSFVRNVLNNQENYKKLEDKWTSQLGARIDISKKKIISIFSSLIELLLTTFYIKNEIDKFINEHKTEEIQTSKMPLETYVKNTLSFNSYFQDFKPTFELITESSESVNVFEFVTSDFKTKNLMYLLNFPDLYSLGTTNDDLIKYKNFSKILLSDHDLSNSYIKKRINNYITARTNSHISFSSEDTVVIIRHNTSDNEFKRIYNSHFWAEIYFQVNVFKKEYIEKKLQDTYLERITDLNEDFYINSSSELSDIQYKLHNQLYGVNEISKIINQKNRIYDYESSLEILHQKIKISHGSFLETSQARWLTYSFIVGSLNLVITYIMSIFTILANILDGFDYSLLMVFVGVNTFMFFFSACFVGFTVSKYLILKKKINQITKRKRKMRMQNSKEGKK